MTKKVTFPGKVEKIIKPVGQGHPEKVQIAVEGADTLYRELRIKNSLADREGNKVRLKQDAEVDVTIEADTNATMPINGQARP
jgi:hypothetical protein